MFYFYECRKKNYLVLLLFYDTICLFSKCISKYFLHHYLSVNRCTIDDHKFKFKFIVQKQIHFSMFFLKLFFYRLLFFVLPLFRCTIFQSSKSTRIFFIDFVWRIRLTPYKISSTANSAIFDKLILIIFSSPQHKQACTSLCL